MNRYGCGRLDLVAVVTPVDAEDMKIVPTGELRLNFVLRPDHRLAERREITFAEVSEEQWVSFAKSNPARRWLDDNSRKAGFRPTISAEIETFTQLKAFVEAGHGIALAPAEFLEQELALGLLRAVPSIEPAAAIGVGYAYDERVSRQPGTAMQGVLEQQLRLLTPSSASSRPA